MAVKRRVRLSDKEPDLNVPGKFKRSKWTIAAIRDWAFASGELPHVFLLRISRGEKIGGYEPTFADRVDAAKSVANFFVPKMQSIALTGDGGGPVQTQVLHIEPSMLKGLTDDELDILERVLKGLHLGDGDAKSRKTIEANPDDYSSTLDD